MSKDNPNRKNPLPILEIIDEIVIDESGDMTMWACAGNFMELTDETIKTCPAPPEKGGACPRKFTKTFECRQYGL